MTVAIPFRYRNRPFEVRIEADGALLLYLDRVLRKRREAGPEEPQYVWTNVELEWEEHHYVEARYWASERRVMVTVNGALLLEQVLEQVLEPAPALVPRTGFTAGPVD